MSDNPNILEEPPRLTSINDVLYALDQIITISIRENSTAGIFAYVYRRTTAKVKEGILNNRFEDNQRMELFDVAFARKYINAYRRYRNGDKVARVWERTFAVVGQKHTILQHILLGMNAHINFDLAIAAAEFTPGEQIHALESDFMLINLLLAELVDEIQQRISRVSPLFFLADWIGKEDDEAIVNFSMTNARKHAWRFATRLAKASDENKKDIIEEVDYNMTNLGRIVANPPGFLLPKTLQFIRFFEEKNTRRVIEKLRI